MTWTEVIAAGEALPLGTDLTIAVEQLENILADLKVYGNWTLSDVDRWRRKFHNGEVEWRYGHRIKLCLGPQVAPSGEEGLA